MLWDKCTCTLMICSLLTVCSFSLVITPKLPFRPCLSWADSLRWGMRDLRHSRTPIRQWRLVSSSTGITMSKSTYEMLHRILYHLYMEGQVIWYNTENYMYITWSDKSLQRALISRSILQITCDLIAEDSC